jgi:cysteine synthase
MPPRLNCHAPDLIGNTPLLQLKGEHIFAKAEFLNPGGSIKDRVALAMLEDAATKKTKGNVVTVLPDRAERYFSTSLL